MKTVVDLTVYERILEFYSRVALAHSNTFDFFDTSHQSFKVYEDLIDLWAHLQTSVGGLSEEPA